MAILDIVLILILVWALYSGLKDGVIVQLSGIAGVFVGVYLAFRFAPTVGEWLGVDSSYATIVGFAVVVVVVIIAVAVAARVVRKLIGIAGLGLLDRVGGGLFSILKIGLVMGVLIFCFDSLNSSRGWVKKDKLERSKLYTPLLNVATFAFPYINVAAKHLLPEEIWSDDDQPQQVEEIEEPEQTEDSEHRHTI